MKRYVIRAVKYFFYFSIVCSLIVGALVMTGAVQGNIDTMFRGGWNAVWKIALMFAAVAAVYPKVGFIGRETIIAGSWADNAEQVKSFFAERNYFVESDTAEITTLRRKGFAGKLSRMWEDRLTITHSEGGPIMIEGPRKDVIRYISSLEQIFSPRD